MNLRVLRISTRVALMMNKARLAGVAGIALITIAPLHAADLGVRPVYRGPPPVAVVPVFSWTGCYIGGHAAGDGLTRRYPFRP